MRYQYSAQRRSGRWPRAFDKLTPGLALVQANRRSVLVGGDAGGGNHSPPYRRRLQASERNWLADDSFQDTPSQC